MHRVIAILLMAVIAGCSKSAPPAAEGAGAAALTTQAPTASTAIPAAALAQTDQAVKPVPAEIPSVVARVNGEDISKSDFENAVRNLESSARGQVPPTERDRIFRRVLDELIGYKLLLQESRTRKVIVPEIDLDARMGEVQKQFPSEDAFKKMLAARNLTVQQVRAELKNELVVNRLIEAEIASKAVVSPAEIDTFYQRNPKQFQLPEKVRASHVLIGVPAGADAPAKATAMTTAMTVLKKARTGADFAALAREYSQDPGTAASGGDLGFFEQGKMVGAFNDAAFKLAKGEVSDVVETEFGYHIIKVTDKQPGRTVPLDEARPQIENYLKSVNRQKEMQAFVRSLRAKSKVDVFL